MPSCLRVRQNLSRCSGIFSRLYDADFNSPNDIQRPIITLPPSPLSIRGKTTKSTPKKITMVSTSTPEAQPLTSQSSTQLVATNPTDASAKLLHNLLSLSAAALFFSFFMPWISFLGATLNGFTIQKNFESYRIIWLIPLLAVISLVLNIAGQKTSFIRRLAGLSPFAILVYALSDSGGQIFQAMGFGAWIALAAGSALVFIPNKAK
jgi:hypothetical protein